jgi:hypothetical protein
MTRRIALGSAALTLALVALSLASTTRGFQGTVTAIDHKAKTLSWKSLPDSGSPPKSLTATWDEKTQFLQQAQDSFETTPTGPERVKTGAKVYAAAVDEKDTGTWRLKEVRLIP